MVLEGFERFTQHGRSFHPKISIRKRGQVGFNNGAIKRFGLEAYDYVVIYYNKDKDKIGFKFTKDENAEGATKIVKRTGNYFFSGKSFLDYYEIKYNETEAFDVEWDSANELAVIDLSKRTNGN